MARSHVVVALGVALITSLIVSQLIYSFGVPQVDFWRWHAEPGFYDGTHQTHLAEKQSSEPADDPSQYLIGVGKADITG